MTSNAWEAVNDLNMISDTVTEAKEYKRRRIVAIHGIVVPVQ